MGLAYNGVRWSGRRSRRSDVHYISCVTPILQPNAYFHAFCCFSFIFSLPLLLMGCCYLHTKGKCKSKKKTSTHSASQRKIERESEQENNNVIYPYYAFYICAFCMWRAYITEWENGCARFSFSTFFFLLCFALAHKNMMCQA